MELILTLPLTKFWSDEARIAANVARMDRGAQIPARTAKQTADHLIQHYSASGLGDAKDGQTYGAVSSKHMGRLLANMALQGWKEESSDDESVTYHHPKYKSTAITVVEARKDLHPVSVMGPEEYE